MAIWFLSIVLYSLLDRTSILAHTFSTAIVAGLFSGLLAPKTKFLLFLAPPTFPLVSLTDKAILESKNFPLDKNDPHLSWKEKLLIQ